MRKLPASAQRSASALVYLVEELGDARLRCDQLIRYLNEAVKLIEKSEHRDHFFEVAGHLIHAIPDAAFRLDKALKAVSLAASRIDYEELKQDLRPEKVQQLEKVLQEVRIRPVQRRSEPVMNPKQAIDQLKQLAQQTRETGTLPRSQIAALIMALEEGSKTASTVPESNPADMLDRLASALEHGHTDRKPSKVRLAGMLRKLLADDLSRVLLAEEDEKEEGVQDKQAAEEELSPLALVGSLLTTMKVVVRNAEGDRWRVALLHLADLVNNLGLLLSKLGSPEILSKTSLLSREIMQSARAINRTLSEAPAMLMASEDKEAFTIPEIFRKTWTRAKQEGRSLLLEGDAEALGQQLEGYRLDLENSLDEAKQGLLRMQQQSSSDNTSALGRLLVNLASSIQTIVESVAKVTVLEPQIVTAKNWKSAGARDKNPSEDMSTADLWEATNKALHAKQWGKARALLDDLGLRRDVPKALSSAESYGLSGPYLDIIQDRIDQVNAHAKRKHATEELQSRFEEGKPADPTKNMDPDDAEKWKAMNKEHGDKFKKEARSPEPQMLFDQMRHVVDLLLDARVAVRRLHEMLKSVEQDATGTVFTDVYDNPQIKDLFKRLYDLDRDIGVLDSIEAMERRLKGMVARRTASEDEEKQSRFEEGKPADPTKNMNPDDAEKWKANTDKYEDKFKKEAEDEEKQSRFEEGKPADPTKNMDPDDAEKWKSNTDKYEDKFKTAASEDPWKVTAAKFESGDKVRVKDSHGSPKFRGDTGEVEKSVQFGKYYVELEKNGRSLVDGNDLEKV